MNTIKFLDSNKQLKEVKICQSKYMISFHPNKVLSRRAAFILAKRKGWTHPKMVQQQ